MPFIVTKVNVTLSREQQTQLKSGFGQAIECIPGKSENALLLCFEDSSHLYLRGDDTQPMAYITVAVFANPTRSGYAQLSLAITQLFQETLGIDPANVYIRYEDIPCWSVSGQTFGAALGSRE